MLAAVIIHLWMRKLWKIKLGTLEEMAFNAWMPDPVAYCYKYFFFFKIQRTFWNREQGFRGLVKVLSTVKNSLRYLFCNCIHKFSIMWQMVLLLKEEFWSKLINFSKMLWAIYHYMKLSFTLKVSSFIWLLKT